MNQSQTETQTGCISPQEALEYICEFNTITKEIIASIPRITNQQTACQAITVLISCEKANPARNNNKCIFLASENNNVHIVKLLLTFKDVDPCDYVDRAILSAVLNKNYEVLELLVSDNRVNNNYFNYYFILNNIPLDDLKILGIFFRNMKNFPVNEINHLISHCVNNKISGPLALMLTDLKFDNKIDYHTIINNAIALTDDNIMQVALSNSSNIQIFTNYYSVNFIDIISFFNNFSTETCKLLISHPTFRHESYKLIIVTNIEQIKNKEVLIIYFSHPKVGISYANNKLLLYAINKGDTKYTQQIISSPEIDLSINSHEIIHSLIRMRNYDILNMLLQRPDFDPCTNNNQILIFATERNNEELVNLVLNHHKFKQGTYLMTTVNAVTKVDIFNIFKSTLYYLNYNTSTAMEYAIHIAQTANYPDLVKTLKEHPKYMNPYTNLPY